MIFDASSAVSGSTASCLQQLCKGMRQLRAFRAWCNDFRLRASSGSYVKLITSCLICTWLRLPICLMLQCSLRLHKTLPYNE